MDLKIRKAKEKDLPSFFTFFKATLTKEFPEYKEKTRQYMLGYGYSLKRIKKGLKTGGWQLFLAFGGQKIVGFLLSRIQFGGVAWGEWIAVDKKYQRKGIGSSLLKIWEKQAIKDGAHQLQFVSSLKASSFYQKEGAVLVGKTPKAYFGIDNYYFYKNLRKPNEKNFLKDYLKNKKNIINDD